MTKHDESNNHQPLISYEELLEEFKALLKSNALKFTKQREIILKTLYENPGHFTPEEIYRHIQQSDPSLKVGIATIYRTLSLLESSKIASSISFGAQGKKFELGIKAHHDHLICTSCGKIIEFFDEEIEARQAAIADAHGFSMQDHSMKIYGICSDCQKHR